MTPDLAARLAALSPAQRALVELRLKGTAGRREPAIPRCGHRDNIPLSLDQERLWFVQQLDPSSAAYNIYTAVRFKGAVEVRLLESALNEIVRRHEIMRTSFVAPDGRPIQCVAPSLRVHIPVVDLRGIPAVDREREAGRLAVRNVGRPFDLTALPLFRTVLLQVEDAEFVCPTVFHHIITDWIAFHVFDRELATLYAAFRDGRRSTLPPLPIQYADFAVWQRRWLGADVLDTQIAYWRRQLADAPPLIELPRDRPRPSMQTARGFRQPLTLTAEQSRAVRELAQRHEITSFIALLAMFQTVLFRLTGQSRIVVGSPIANRNQPELEQLLGFFINHLAFCTDMSGDPPFEELVRRVRDVALGAYANQDVPFGRVVDALQPERDLSRTPVTQVVFLFLNPQQQGGIEFSGLRILPYMIDSESSKFDMTFSLWEQPTGFSGWIEYNPDLFDRTTVVRLGEQFRTLLGAAVRGPAQRVSALALLSAAERQLVLREWTETPAVADGGPVAAAVAAQARRRPTAVAVQDAHETLTFAALDARAARLARRLRQVGVGPEVLVGVALPPGVAMVVAWLAVWKAGGAYIPWGVGTPPPRWAEMLAEAGARVVIAPGPAGRDAAGRVVVGVDDTADGALPDPAAEPALQLAYVLFTSGSTGRPKGVAVTHGGVRNLVAWHAQRYGVGPADRASQLANPGFDAAGWELWPALAHGASVTIAPAAVRQDPEALLAWLAREAVTLCFLPTPWAEATLDDPAWAQTAVRALLTGGDRLQRRAAGALATRFYNHYGPTEGTVVATAGPVAAQGAAAPDLGRPIAQVETYVLDAHQQPVAIGVVGELYLGGAGLARGYLGQAAATAARFVPDGVSGQAGRRLYRTGDLVRWGRDGRLHFVGRRDGQVKLRGYRIELAEIDAALAALPGVATAAVVLSPGPPPRLRGYLTGTALDPDTLRTALRQRLPDYMVPATLTLLPHLPLTRHGKIDRDALAAYHPADPAEAARTVVAPRTPAEETLVTIWRDVLGLDQVGVTDNFFRVGGESILGLQVVARARAAGLHLTPRQIFEHQTIAELAAIAAPGPEIVTSAVALSGPIALTPIQRWFFEQDLLDPHHFNHAMLFEIPGWPAVVVARAVDALQAHHDALRLRFHRGNDGWRAEIAARAPSSLSVIDVSRLPGASLSPAISAIAADLERSLSLERGPIFRAVLFQPGESAPSRLLLVAHHLAVDGVSWRILLADLEAACDQASRSPLIVLPQKTTDLRRWSERLDQFAGSDEVRRDGQWWDRAAAVSSPLPIDADDGPNTVASSATVDAALDGGETRALLDQSGSAYRIQPQELLLTACAEATAEWSGAPVVRVDVESHGRDLSFDDVDLSRTVGWFTTISPVAVVGSRALDGVTRLALVKSGLRAIPRQGLAYAVRRYACDPPAAAVPAAAVLFNYLGRLDLALRQNSPLVPAAEDVGPTRSPRDLRRYLLEIDAAVIDGRLRLRWTYSRNRHADATIERLSSETLASLRRLLSGRSPGDSLTPNDFPLAPLDGPQLSAIVGRYGAPDDVYRLSSLQEGMLLYSLAASIHGGVCEQLTCVLSGTLDVGLFRAAWQEVVQRHSILRTCFVWEQLRSPVQVVLPAAHVPLTVIDARHTTGDAADHWQAVLQRDREAGMDLTRAPLMRLTLARIGEDTWRCLWTYHHLILDGWSLSLVLQEVVATYHSLTSARLPAPATSRPYADYVRWLSVQDQVQAEAFWRESLRGFSKPTPIGGRGANGPPAHHDYGDEVRELPDALHGVLEALSRDAQVTLNTVFQGAWALLLAGRSAHEDVVFGATVSGRPAHLPGVESIVGVFINVLPVRTHVRADATIASWLQTLQANQARAKQFEHSTLVQEWSDVPLGLPLFDTLVVFENYPRAASTAPQGGFEIRDVQSLVRTRFPLTLVVLPGKTLRMYLSHDRRRFDEGAAAAVLGDLETVLRAMADAPGGRLSDILGSISRPQTEVVAASDSELPIVVPRTTLEHVVAPIWNSTLGRAASITDSLFQAGGHSLLAARIAARLSAALALDVPLRWIFEAPTIAGLAQRLEAELAGGRRLQLPPIEPGAIHQTGVLSYSQEPLWMAFKMLPGLAVLNFAATFRLQGPLDVAALDASFATIVHRHQALRTAFVEEDGLPVTYVRDITFRMPLVDLSGLSENGRIERAAAVVAADSARVFDLTDPPLIRATCVRLTSTDHLLTVSIHHIATDGWSTGVLARELAILYEAHSRQRLAELPPLTVQYGDFARWERARVAAGDFDADLRGWIDAAGSWSERLALPTDAPRRGLTLLVGREDSFVTGDLLTRLRATSAREGVSLFMTLLTGFELMLAQASGQRDFCIGTLMANRSRPEVEHLMGLFVNTVLFQCTIGHDATCRDLLHQSRDAVLQGFSREHVPFEVVLNALERERHIDRSEICQVLFVMQNAAEELTLHGLEVKALQSRALGRPGFYPTAFELVANVIESPDQLLISISYKSDLFAKERVQDLVQRWIRILEAMDADMGRSAIADLA